MRVGPKYKIARRLGADVFEKTQTQKFQLNSDKKAKSLRRRGGPRSDYAKQMLAKQKVRVMYGISERQFSRYAKEAALQRSVKSTDALFQTLESRLDNVVYRIGLASTRRFARQLVSHGHIEVNGKRTTVPSYVVKKGDKIKVRANKVEKGPFQDLAEKTEKVMTPAWLTFNPKEKTGEVKGVPQLTPSDSNLDLASVMEFYSR